MNDTHGLPPRSLEAWMGFLTGPRRRSQGDEFRIADVFCSVGGLTLGASEALIAQGLKPVVSFAADLAPDALAVYEKNFKPLVAIEGSMDDLVQMSVKGTGAKATIKGDKGGIEVDRRLRQALRPDLLLAGPPCQGHSMLNNHTRYDDPRNQLYLKVPALAIKLGIPNVIIENVPGVLRDANSVAVTAEGLLNNYGYRTTSGVIGAHKIGWPQTRQRFFLIASKWGRPESIAQILSTNFATPKPVVWALRGLPEKSNDEVGMQEPPNLSAENIRRIEVLIKSGELNMPLRERPPSHSSGTTYMANYGRMDRDKPAPTLTTGYATPGRGRFIHPNKSRTLLPREAARIQGFPDWFRFSANGSRPARAALNTWIGNAVPSILGFVTTSALPIRHHGQVGATGLENEGTPGIMLRWMVKVRSMVRGIRTL